MTWPAVTSEIPLEAHDIHVVSAWLDDFREHRSRLDAVLSADEHVRASRFRFARDRDRFMIGRSILRRLLAAALGQPPATLVFSYGQFGKPAVAGRNGHGPLFFNASRSSELALYALTWACPVGVDIERVREIPDVGAIASRHFAPADASRLISVPADRRGEEFLACWTRKEALLKAIGEGLGDERVPSADADWQLQTLQPAAEYVAAIAYRRDAARLSLWSLSKESLCK